MSPILEGRGFPELAVKKLGPDAHRLPVTAVVNAAELAVIKQYAAEHGKTVSAYLRMVALHLPMSRVPQIEVVNRVNRASRLCSQGRLSEAQAELTIVLNLVSR